MKKNYTGLFTVLMFVMFAGFTFAGEPVKIKEAKFPAKSGEMLSVNISGGDINVTSWDKDEVEIIIKGNETAAKKISFEIEKTSEGVKVESSRTGGGFWNIFNSLNFRVIIKTPEKYNMKLKTSGGDVEVKKIEGDTEVYTSGGDVVVYGGKGNGTFKTSGGDVSVNDFYGPAIISTSGGDIVFNGKNGDVNASTSGGDIAITGADSKIKAETSGGDIHLVYKGENKGIHLSTTGGDIFADFDDDLSGYIDASTTGGDVENNNSKFRADKITSSSIKGTLNNGGENIRLRTSGGDITIQ